MNRRRLASAAVACLGVVALVAAAAITWRSVAEPSGRAPGQAGSGAPAVVDLRDAGQLRQRFNADQGRPRLVVALAPT